IARFSAHPERAPHAPSLVRTMEIPYWGIGLALGIGIAAIAPFIAHGMRTALPIRTVEQSLLVMALAVALQWPMTFYAGGIMGLQRQVLWNVINAAGATIRALGAIIVVSFFPSTVAFFVWQAIAAARSE